MLFLNISPYQHDQTIKTRSVNTAPYRHIELDVKTVYDYAATFLGLNMSISSPYDHLYCKTLGPDSRKVLNPHTT